MTGPPLADSLASLQRAHALDEIIIVDNGNAIRESAILDAAAQADRRVRVLRGQGNVGFAAGCNLGARAASGETICFVNPDAVLAPDAIERLGEVLKRTPMPALVGGDLRDPRGRPDRGSRRERLTLWRAFVSFSGLARFERLAPWFRDFNRHWEPLPKGPLSMSAVSGALMMVRRSDFEALGGFDEGYFLHVEDLDLCRRAEDRGWKVLFVPGPHGVHVRSSSQVDARTIAAHKARGIARYFTKFAAGPFERLLSQAAVTGFLLISSPDRTR